MEYYLNKKYLYLPLSVKTKNPMSTIDEKWEILDRKALGKYGCV